MRESLAKIMLATRPEHDDVTYYLSKWSEKSIAFAKSRNFRVFDLQGSKANRKDFESYNSKNDVSFIVFNGHGNYNAVMGHKDEVLVSVGKNEYQLKSRIVYAISCASAENLGKKSVEAGAISYIGYTEDFLFIYDSNSTTRPLEDVEAKIFFEHSEVLIQSLIKGSTVAEAYEKSRQKLKDNYYSLLNSDRESNNDAIAYLFWDLINFKALGSQSATV